MSLDINAIAYGEVHVTDEELFDYILDKSLNDEGKYCIFTMYPDKYRTDKIHAYSTGQEVRGTRSQFVYIMADALKGNTDEINDILAGVVAICNCGTVNGLQILINKGIRNDCSSNC